MSVAVNCFGLFEIVSRNFCAYKVLLIRCIYALMYTVRGYLPASEDIKDNLMGVDRVQEELQQLNQIKQVCITYIIT